MGERIATASVRTGLAMTWYLQGVQCAAGHMGPTPQLSILQGRARVPCRECGKNSGRAVEDAGPYGSATRGAMGGRPQGSPLRRGYKECDAVRNPPVTASPCQSPLGKGAYKDGGCGLPRARCALAMTVFLQGTGARPGGSSGRPTPTTPFTDRTS